jgi:hypothetical protein
MSESKTEAPVEASPRGFRVSCARDPSAEAGEGVEDLFGGLGPDERLGVFVPVFDPGSDVGFEGMDVLVCEPLRV